MNPLLVNFIASVFVFVLLLYISRKQKSLPLKLQGKLKYFHFGVSYLLIGLNMGAIQYVLFTVENFDQLGEFLNSFEGIFGSSFNWFIWFFHLVSSILAIFVAGYMIIKPEGKRILIQACFFFIYLNVCLQFYFGAFKNSPDKSDIGALFNPVILMTLLFYTGVYGSFAYLYSKSPIVDQLKLRPEPTRK